MRNKQPVSLLAYAALAGNILFIVWITFNAIKERFQGTLPETVSAIGLIGLLVMNSFLLLRKKRIETYKNFKSIELFQKPI